MKVAIYSRKSKFTQKGESIENQIQMCKDYCSVNLKDISDYFIYEDEGFSGKNTNRPEFQRLLNDAYNKKFDILICYRLDRISRNVADFSNTLEMLQSYEINFISIKEQFDTTTPMGRAMIYIASVFAQLERETIAERVRDNMLELAKTGRWLGGIPPLGYNNTTIEYYDESMKKRTMVKLIPCDEELELVKLIFEKYIELKSLSSVSSFLLQNYYTSRNGAQLSMGTIRKILENPVYVKSSAEIFNYLESNKMITCGEPDGIHGFITYNKLRFAKSKDGTTIREYRDKSEWIAAISNHKGIIDDTDWLNVQKIISSNKNRFITSARTHNALLTSILRCAKCGSRMRIMHGPTSKKTGIKNFYYACTLKKDSKGTRCNNGNVNVANLDPIVLNALKKLGDKKSSVIKQLELECKQEKKELVKTNSIENLNNLIETKQKQINNLLDKLSLDPELSDIMIDKIKVLKKEIAELNEKINDNNCLMNEISQSEINISFIRTLLNKCSIIDSLEHDELKTLIRGLTKEMTWNGDTQQFKLKFIGTDDSKKKLKLLTDTYDKKSQVRLLPARR